MTDDARRFAWAAPDGRVTVDFRNLPDEPRNPLAESATLGALMLSARCVDDLLPILRVDHFTSRPHQETFEAIRAVHTSGRPVDPILVHDQLQRSGTVQWGTLSAATFVHACIEATYFPGHGMSYAVIVLENATRRRIVQAGVRIAQAASQGSVNLDDLLRTVEAEIQATTTSTAEYARLSAMARVPVRLGDVIAALRTEFGPSAQVERE